MSLSLWFLSTNTRSLSLEPLSSSLSLSTESWKPLTTVHSPLTEYFHDILQNQLNAVVQQYAVRTRTAYWGSDASDFCDGFKFMLTACPDYECVSLLHSFNGQLNKLGNAISECESILGFAAAGGTHTHTHTLFKNTQQTCMNKMQTRKCTLWRCKSTPTPKAKLLWMT